jgi:hypothetical protein
VHVTPAQFLEAAAGAGQADRDTYTAALAKLKLLGNCFGNREHGAGSVDADDRCLRSRGGCGGFLAAAASAEQSGERYH